MSENKLTLMSEEFQNEKTGEVVEGITIIVDGKIKTAMDIIMQKESKYNSYSEIVRDALFEGIEKIINSL